MENNSKNYIYENRRYNTNQMQIRKRRTIENVLTVPLCLMVLAVSFMFIITVDYRSEACDLKGDLQVVRMEEEHTASLQSVKPQMRSSVLTSTNPIKNSSNTETETQEIEIEPIETESLETKPIVEDTTLIETQEEKIDWSQIEATPENSGYEHCVYDPGYADEPGYVFEPEYNDDGTVNYFGWTYEDFDYLSQCIAGEAGYCSWKWQMYVGSVVLNRVHHKVFKENTIKEICLAPKQYACFNQEVGRVTYTTVTEKNKAVAYELLKNGSILPYNVLFQAEFKQGAGVYEHIGNTYFCYFVWW